MHKIMQRIFLLCCQLCQPDTPISFFDYNCFMNTRLGRIPFLRKLGSTVLLIKGFLCFHGIYLQIIMKYRKREFQYFVSLTE